MRVAAGTEKRAVVPGISGCGCVSACALPTTARVSAALQCPQGHVNPHPALEALGVPQCPGTSHPSFTGTL